MTTLLTSGWQRLLSLVKIAGLSCLAVSAPACTVQAPSEGETQMDAHALARREMVDRQMAARGIADPAVLQALQDVPRHLFVPPEIRHQAYEDGPLPIGYGQTISQPYIVAFMTEALRLKPADRVLEVGTGCGYQAAVLSRLVQEVYSIEIVQPLAARAGDLLKTLGCDNVEVRAGDGYAGWPEKAPFDAIVVTAAPDHVPQALIDQLADGGRLVMPVGTYWQDLIRISRQGKNLKRETLLPVRFVPMTGGARSR